jgi:hypothetical protein
MDKTPVALYLYRNLGVGMENEVFSLQNCMFIALGLILRPYSFPHVYFLLLLERIFPAVGDLNRNG